MSEGDQSSLLVVDDEPFNHTLIDIYAAGGRGPGRSNPHKSVFVTGFKLSSNEKAELIAFLTSLTDEIFLTNPRFSDPFTQAFK